MRVALFSPMPPAKSGIADYSAALAEPLGRLAELRVFDSGADAFDPSGFDVALYQIGNNPYHQFVYEAALRHPGVVVLHEANLHHLIAELTIRRGDWDGYVREVRIRRRRRRRSPSPSACARSRSVPITTASR